MSMAIGVVSRRQIGSSPVVVDFEVSPPTPTSVVVVDLISSTEPMLV